MTDYDEPTGMVAPSALIERFCGTPAAAALAQSHGPQRDEKIDATVSRGHCGYMGGRGDLLDTGFGDGYDFMEYLTSCGWRSLPAKGEWPYVVYLRWPAREGEPAAIAEFCEGDLTIWQFDSHQSAVALYNALKDNE